MVFPLHTDFTSEVFVLYYLSTFSGFKHVIWPHFITFSSPPPKKKSSCRHDSVFSFLPETVSFTFKSANQPKDSKKSKNTLLFYKVVLFFCLELCFTGIFNTCISLSDMFEWESSDISVFLLFLSVFYVPVQRVQTLTDEAALMSLLWYWTHFRHKNLKGKRSL